MNLSKQFNVALEAIKKGIKAILDVYFQDFKVNLKEDHSVVTQADLNSDKIIRQTLMENFPHYGILSEETKDNQDRTHKDFCWIVDPLDGTKDFVNHTNEFSINIALSYKNKIVLGLIAIPLKNLVYYAQVNEGAFKLDLNNNVTTKIHVNDKKDKLTLLISNFFFSDELLNKLKTHPLIETITHCGSSYKACKIAEGLAELNVKYDDKTKEWDTAPAEIIIREAGGYMLDMYGNENLYNKVDVVNHNGFIISNNFDNLKHFIKIKK